MSEVVFRVVADILYVGLPGKYGLVVYVGAKESASGSTDDSDWCFKKQSVYVDWSFKKVIIMTFVKIRETQLVVPVLTVMRQAL